MVVGYGQRFDCIRRLVCICMMGILMRTLTGLCSTTAGEDTRQVTMTQIGDLKGRADRRRHGRMATQMDGDSGTTTQTVSALLGFNLNLSSHLTVASQRV